MSIQHLVSNISKNTHISTAYYDIIIKINCTQLRYCNDVNKLVWDMYSWIQFIINSICIHQIDTWRNMASYLSHTEHLVLCAQGTHQTKPNFVGPKNLIYKNETLQCKPRKSYNFSLTKDSFRTIFEAVSAV